MIRSRDNLSLVIPNNKTIEHERLKVYILQITIHMKPCNLHTNITHVCRLCIYSGSIWYHINTLPQEGFDPPQQRVDCYQSTTPTSKPPRLDASYKSYSKIKMCYHCDRLRKSNELFFLCELMLQQDLEIVEMWNSNLGFYFTNCILFFCVGSNRVASGLII